MTGPCQLALLPTLRRVLAVLVAVCLAVGPTSTALAAKPKPADRPRKTQAADETEKAAMISVAAKNAFDKGEFNLAARLYEDAFEADPATIGYLYSAARALQKAGKLEDADKQYRRVLTLAEGKDPDLVEKTKSRLAEVAAARKQADDLRAAAEERRKAEEERRLAAEERKKAEEARAKQGPAEVKPVPVPPTEVRQQEPRGPGTWQDPIGWTSAGAGAMAGIAAVVVMGLASADLTDLRLHLPSEDGDPPTGTRMYDYDEARAAADDIEAKWLTAGVLGGLAAAGLAFGGYRLLSPRPAGSGAKLTWELQPARPSPACRGRDCVGGALVLRF